MKKSALIIMSTIVVISFFLACGKEAGSNGKHKHVEETDKHEGHKHSSGDKDTCKEEEKKVDKHSESEEKGHDHQKHENGEDPHDLELIAKKKCEHGILQIECNECRAELGVVKLDPNIEKQFIKTEQVSKSVALKNLNLVGEVGLNQSKTVVVTPIVSGRVSKVVKKLGDQVNERDVLVILQSQEHGKAKLDYISACQRYSLAQKNYEWFKTTHENLKNLVAIVQQGQKNLDLAKVIVGIKIGKYKEKIVETTTQYKTMKAKYERETQVVQNVKKALQLFQKTQNLDEVDKELANLRMGEWKGKLLGAISKLQAAQKNYEREQTLAKTNSTTPKELQEAESNYRSAQGEYRGLVEELSLWTEQKEQDLQTDLEASLARYLSTVEEIEIDLEVHRLEVEKELHEAISQKATNEKMLSLLGLSEKDIQSLSMDNHESIQNLGTLELRAPVKGTIFSCAISEGQFVEANRELYVISDLTVLWVWGELYESQLDALKPFQDKLSTIKTTLETSNHDSIPVMLDYLSEKVDEKTRTVKIRGLIQNGKSKLKPGLFVKMRLEIPSQKEINTVPEEAIFKDEKQSFLFKKWKDQFWVRNEVSLGTQIGDRQEILAGISEGDVIVASGGFILKSEILKAKMGSG